MFGTRVVESITHNLNKEGVLKDVLQVGENEISNFQAKGLLAVEYGGSNAVALGNTLPVDDTQHAPAVQFVTNAAHGADIGPTDLLTLVLTDPDAPSRSDNSMSEYCHWVKTDITVLDAKRDAEFMAYSIHGDSTSVGKKVMSYMGPAPPKGTGKHRYVFLLYKQPDGTPGDRFTHIKDRKNWGYGVKGVGAHKWAEENGLKLIGANFFLAEVK